MINLNFKQLLKRFLSAESTEEEVVLVEEFMVNGSGVFDEVTTAEEITTSYAVQNKTRHPIKSKKSNWPLNILFAVAIFVAVSGIWTVLFQHPTSLPIDYINDIEPGSSKALLSLPNGKSIQLGEGQKGVVAGASQLSYRNGTLTSKVSQPFSVSTPRGGTVRLNLPDGTKVWLNAGSSLSYMPPNQEDGAYRNVNLSGEAYFEVSKDINHPFVVTTEKQRITVLGTHFNVSAYNDELSTKTTLLEGSVAVVPLTTSGVEGTSMLLKPNQEYTYTAATEKAEGSIDDVKVDEAVSWKNGEFNFSGEKLESIMLKVARWYDVEVVYTDERLADKPFNGTVSRFSKVSQVLCLLENTGEVHFRVEGRRITVMP